MKSIVYETITKQAALLRSGEMTSEALTLAYLEEIERQEKEIGAFLYIDREGALKKAREVDEKLSRGESCHPLAGIPMAIKDNICTTDMPTTCASKMLEGYRSPFDAGVVNCLREVDAVVLGKLNMDEFAMGASTENSYFKKTKNPVDLERVPGGSSGGSAAAVAAHMAAYTLGSDTGGSIRQPASFCGIVGLKPTYGRLSRNGLIAFASSLDQIGPMGKTVSDVAMVYKALAKHDEKDSTSGESESFTVEQLLEKSVKGMKVALPMNFLSEGIDADVKETVLYAAKVFASLGAIIETVDFNGIDAALPAYYLISSAEASSNLARFDGVKYGYRTETFTTLEELYKKTRGEGFGSEVKRRILLGTYALSSGYYDAYYQKALKIRTMIAKTYDALFEKYDFILSPVAPSTAYRFGEHSKNPVEMYLGDIYTVPINIAGLPAISINAGYDRQHLPVGIQLIGKAYDERTILSAANAFEASKKIWRAEQ